MPVLLNKKDDALLERNGNSYPIKPYKTNGFRKFMSKRLKKMKYNDIMRSLTSEEQREVRIAHIYNQYKIRAKIKSIPE